MQLWVIILIILGMVFNSGGFSDVFSLKRSVDDHSFEELTIIGCDRTFDNGKDLYYTGEIKGDTARRLYEIVCEQTRQPELTGGNYGMMMPYLLIKAPHGKVYTCYNTWDREEYSIDDEFRCPTVAHVGDCFIVEDANSARTKYQAIDTDTMNEFYSLIHDYLEKNYEPSETFNEKCSVSNIVFVNRHTNYAWVKTDIGTFIDSNGNLYSFDFSDRYFQNDKEFYEALCEVYENSDPVSYWVVDSGKMWDVLEKEIPKIDRNAEVTERSGGCDMGQTTLYAASLEGKPIMLRSIGDWEKHLDDAAAKRICRIYDAI